MRLVIPVVVLERDRFMRLKSVGDSDKLALLKKQYSYKPEGGLLVREADPLLRIMGDEAKALRQ
jgi:hypothetical protein